LKAFTLTYGQVKPGIRVHYDCGFGLHDIIVGQTNRPFLHREEKVSLSSDLDRCSAPLLEPAKRPWYWLIAILTLPAPAK
jgi:hypothetical protein